LRRATSPGFDGGNQRRLPEHESGAIDDGHTCRGCPATNSGPIDGRRGLFR
jgi:hypothetical protein